MEQQFVLLDKQFYISDDKSHLDVESIHNYLSEESYWSKGIPLKTVQDSIENSLCVGVFNNNKTIGFARIISDFATYAYLCDVFVLREFQGKGISKKLMSFVMQHPKLKGLRRWSLMTKDAHGVYAQFGWKQMSSPDNAMEINFPNIYKTEN